MAAAERIGYPVVVKPLNANHGRGVSIHLSTDEQVRDRVRGGARARRSVIVESFITGDDHRMLVVNGELVAVAKRVPGHVVGDGDAHDRGARRDREQRSPPRHRPREGAHAADVRPPGRDDAGAEGLHARHGAGGGRAGVPPLDRQPLDRRHRDRPDRRRAPRQPRDGGARGRRRSASTSAASTSSPPTSPSRTRTSAAPSAR